MRNIKIKSDKQHRVKLLFPMQPFEPFESAVLQKRNLLCILMLNMMAVVAY